MILETQEAVVILEQSNILNPGKLREAVYKVDFSVRDISIKAKGEVMIHQQGQSVIKLLFIMPVTKQKFLLIFLKEMEADLQNRLLTGEKQFIIVGKILEPESKPLSLEVISLESQK